MKMTTEAQDTGAIDRRYQEGLAHLQAGEWQQAIVCFEELKHEYPDSQAVQNALEEAQFRAGLDATADFKAKRWAIPWRSLVVRGSILLLIIVLAIMGGHIIQHQVAPALAQTQERLRLEQLEAEGSALLKAGKDTEARASFEQLLVAEPNNEEALEGLEQISEDQEVEEIYQQAVAGWRS
jgi:outer membrane protein assembly factor BamD (BamD/ComL family)